MTKMSVKNVGLDKREAKTRREFFLGKIIVGNGKMIIFAV